MANIEFDSTYLESLTKREMEVLELLASGASNQEIAAALVVELTTVKWYNTQIYGKLQVKNRKQAISRAQSLSILKANSSNLNQPAQYTLPASTLPFIGRVSEIHSLIQQLTDEKVRLVTILGVGGMGKTRLSIEVGRRLVGHFKDGVYFVPFAPVTSSEQIVTTIAETIGFKFHSDKAPKQQLFQHFQKQQVLLIVDNFEHLLDSADFLSELLQHAPQLKLLVTSREKLNLAGEQVHILHGLSAPIDETAATVTDYDAVKLFADTAQRTGTEFKDGDMIVVARICQLLGGMPLAILLAAAWVDTLALADIEAEIKAGLGILESNLRDAPTRHQSIQSAFDSSWKRLSSQEQAVFMRLSVFRDGFTREAAQKVTGASVRDLQRLVHTSFIQLLPSGRYAIHELMRQYGEEKLTVSGESYVIRGKHAQFFAEFITLLGDTPWAMATHKMLDDTRAEFDNVRAAWLFQVEQKNITELRRFLDGFWVFLDNTSRTQEGIELFQPLLNVFSANNDDETLFRGQLLARLAWFYSDTGHHQKAYEINLSALQIVEVYSSANDMFLIYLGLRLILQFLNNYPEAMVYTERGLELAQKLKDTKWLSAFNAGMSFFYLEQGRHEEALGLANKLPDNHRMKTDLMINMHMNSSEFAQAELLLLNSMKKYPMHRIGYTGTYARLIICAVEMRSYEKAWGYVQRGLQYGDDGAYAWGTFGILREAIFLLIAEQQYLSATELLSFLLHHPAPIESLKAAAATHTDELKANLSEEEFEVAWERGKLLELGDVITEYMER